MNKNHLPSIELCRKLTEIGFPPTSVHYDGPMEYREADIYIIPSVMEMLDVIPTSMIINGNKQRLKINSVQWEITKFWIRFWEETNFYDWYGTLPNALAEMILWLHENKYLSFNK